MAAWGLRMVWSVLSLLMSTAWSGPLEDCAAGVRADPEAYRSWSCFQDYARRNAAFEEALTVLQELEVEGGDRYRLYQSGAMLMSLGRMKEAQAELSRAITLLESRGEHERAAFGHLNMVVAFRDGGARPQALASLEQARLAAERSGLTHLQATVLVEEARTLSLEGRSLGRAYAQAQEARTKIFPDGTYQARVVALLTLSRISRLLGRAEESAQLLMEMRELNESEGDGYARAVAMHQLALLVLEDPERLDWAVDHDLDGFLDEMLEVATSSGNRWAEIAAICGLSTLRRDLVEPCLAAARPARDASSICNAQAYEAKRLAEEGDLDGALVLLDECEAVSLSTQDLKGLALTRLDRATLLLEAGRVEAGKEVGFGGLELVEQLRFDQEEDAARSGVLARFSARYYMFAHQLLGEPSEASPERIDAALSVVERMRNQAMLDMLVRNGTAAPTRTERAVALEEELAAARAVLWEATEDEVPDELERVERARAELVEHAMAGLDPATRALSSHIPTVRDLQRALGPDEALLSFQSATKLGDLSGASFAVWIRSDAVRAYALPDRTDLGTRIELLAGIVAMRDGSEQPASEALFDELLGPIASELDAVAQITIIPDGPLHGLPVALLGSAGGPPLVERLVMSRATSLGSWLRARRNATDPQPTASLLAVGDPDLDDTVDLPPLTHARSEAESVAGLRPAGQVLVGSQATEQAVRAAVVDHQLIHLATHAVLHHAFPERSAILLSGSDGEGELDLGEIGELPLDDALVVLAACRSASGRVQGGGGPLGFARAVFHAGGRGVVGSLWPLRDSDAEAIFRDFYDALDRGQTVPEALRHAQRARRAAGAPADAWAGLVYIGDDRFQPLTSRPQPRAWMGWVGMMFGLCAGWLAWRGRREDAASDATP